MQSSQIPSVDSSTDVSNPQMRHSMRTMSLKRSELVMAGVLQPALVPSMERITIEPLSITREPSIPKPHVDVVANTHDEVEWNRGTDVEALAIVEVD